MLTLLLTTVAWAAPLPPGRYAGHGSEGRLDLQLLDDGRAIFGGAALRWRADGDTLVLKPPGGKALRLTVRHDPDGAVLEGAPGGPIRLAPLPDITPVSPPSPPRPLPWIGAWLHRASGGALLLRLMGDGRYEMVQAGTDGRALPTAGAWSARGDALILTPAGGPPLTYTARRDGADLLIGGGDLPVEVRFVPDSPR